MRPTTVTMGAAALAAAFTGPVALAQASPASAPAATQAASPATKEAPKAPPPATSIAEAITLGKFAASARLRFENVQDDAIAKEANATTLRLRVSYETRPFHGVGVLVEGDRLQPLGGDAYNSTRNHHANRPQVPDPEGTDLNQALLRWKGAKDEVILGRQRINLDNQRFIGGVGWRQNEQTFDALTLRTTRIPHLTFGYTYVADVNRVFGPDAGTPPAYLASNTHLANAQFDLGKAGKLTAFAYLLDFRRAAALSNATYGVLWTGSRPLGGGWKLPWSLSYATQADHGANTTHYDAQYWQAEVGAGHGPWTAKVGYEVLSGDATRPGHMFQTPLATLHPYQGWDDKFLTTPAAGVKDLYVSFDSTILSPRTTAQVAWHDFRAEAIGRSYGTELDASVSQKFGKRYEVLLKAAKYDADRLFANTTKWWLQVNASIL